MASRIVSVLTLGVSDLERSTAFYEGLGFRRSQKSSEEINLFATGAREGPVPWTSWQMTDPCPGKVSVSGRHHGHKPEERGRRSITHP
jgi:catechol 2,3-dioxygenase-like lactoylglutathione lyase family enzyme